MTRKIIPYKSRLKQYARSLRNNSTPGEITLWKHLRGKQMLGFDFHRQKPIDNYIVDFFCNELSLAIEIDGYLHENEEALKKDLRRQKRLEELGITVLRFKESEVIKNTRNVIEQIEDWVKATHP